MNQLNLSPALAKVLAKHLKPAKRLSDALQWRADIALVGNAPCIVAHEQVSNYIMVFCGLEEEGFNTFPELFRDRLWREALAICSQANVFDRETLARELTALCDAQYYNLDPHPQEVGRVTKTMEKLERRFLYEKLPLPTDGKSAFEFTLSINSQTAVKGERANQPTAMENLGNLLLGQIDARVAEQALAAKPIMEHQDNIVHVDFAAHRTPPK